MKRRLLWRALWLPWLTFWALGNLSCAHSTLQQASRCVAPEAALFVQVAADCMQAGESIGVCAVQAATTVGVNYIQCIFSEHQAGFHTAADRFDRR